MDTIIQEGEEIVDVLNCSRTRQRRKRCLTGKSAPSNAVRREVDLESGNYFKRKALLFVSRLMDFVNLLTP